VPESGRDVGSVIGKVDHDAFIPVDSVLFLDSDLCIGQIVDIFGQKARRLLKEVRHIRIKIYAGKLILHFFPVFFMLEIY
jgi:hypothetical protein